MTVFITSHPGGYIKQGDSRLPAPFYPDNGFIDELNMRWPKEANLLHVAADPNAYALNDAIFSAISQAFPISGLPLQSAKLCDNRHKHLISDLSKYNVIVLSGGHVPTQNAFFASISLRDALKKFEGIIIGISAGSMNCAETVYSQPELEGEAIDPQYNRYLPGLGLCKYRILPHYQLLKDEILDGLRLFEDITYPDSIGKVFYALCDGSYILVENETSVLKGEAYRIADGVITRISRNNETITL